MLLHYLPTAMLTVVVGMDSPSETRNKLLIASLYQMPLSRCDGDACLLALATVSLGEGLP